MRKGLVHIYFGEGKGKTTSAIGLGIRGAGSGLKVCMFQFLKFGKSSEVNILKKLPNFIILQPKKTFDFFWKLDDKQKEELKLEINEELSHARDIAGKGIYDILILDEILGNLENNLIEESQLIDLITKKHPSVEIVLTGRYASDKLIVLADYVSKIEHIKHPFDKGIEARKGIEY